MGFFTKAADPIQKMKAEAEARPKDHKLLLELAGVLKAKGAVAESAEYYLRAAAALTAVGFGTKAVALLRQVTHMTPKSIPAHEALAKCLEDLKVKEDLRTVLKTLVGLYRGEGRESESQAALKKIDALGPGR